MFPQFLIYILLSVSWS